MFTQKRTVDMQIIDKGKELRLMYSQMEKYMKFRRHGPEISAKVKDLQTKLEGIIKEAELKVLKEKIGIYAKVLALLKP
jgi:hypothetical protein